MCLNYSEACNSSWNSLLLAAISATQLAVSSEGQVSISIHTLLPLFKLATGFWQLASEYLVSFAKQYEDFHQQQPEETLLNTIYDAPLVQAVAMGKLMLGQAIQSSHVHQGSCTYNQLASMTEVDLGIN